MQPSNFDFDELTKALASSTSRRQALKTIVTASVGALLGLGGVSTAFAGHRRRSRTRSSSSRTPKPNRDCAKWCAQVFGPNTSAAGQCTSQAAHGTGLCSTCGNVAPVPQAKPAADSPAAPQANTAAVGPAASVAPIPTAAMATPAAAVTRVSAGRGRARGTLPVLLARAAPMRTSAPAIAEAKPAVPQAKAVAALSVVPRPKLVASLSAVPRVKLVPKKGAAHKTVAVTAVA